MGPLRGRDFKIAWYSFICVFKKPLKSTVSVFDLQCDSSRVQHRSSRDPSHRSSDHSLCFGGNWFTCEGSHYSGGCRMDPVSLICCSKLEIDTKSITSLII